MERKEMEIINWDKGNLFNSSPIIKVKIDMVTCFLLVDTGSSVSFIDKKFLDSRKMLKPFVEKSPITHLSNMLGGVSKSAKMLRTKNLTFKKKKYQQDFMVIDLNIDHTNKEFVYHGILGFDFILEHGVSLNFYNLSFAIRN